MKMTIVDFLAPYAPVTTRAEVLVIFATQGAIVIATVGGPALVVVEITNVIKENKFPTKVVDF
jgi:hypothetical protein